MLLRRPRPLLVLALAAALAHLCAAPAAAGPRQAPPDRATQEEIDRAIDRGATYLMRRQELDGSWQADEHRYIAGQTGLAVYTLLKAGLPASHPAVRRGIAFIEHHPPRWTYGIACCVLALHEADPDRYRDLIEHWVELLLEAHGQGFSYPGGHEDLSLTQYGALALRVATEMGIEVHPKVWEDTLEFALRLQADSGAFSYRPGTERTGSMTSAGIAVVTITRDALAAQGKLQRKVEREAEQAIERGIAWLGEHMVVDRNPDPDQKNRDAAYMRRWRLYYLYGLERVGGLTGRKLFGDRDWYAEASTFLVRTQGGEGQWGTAYGETHPGTCFGVLVLKRATAPSSGAKAPLRRAYGDDDPARDVSLRITGDTPLTLWISSIGDAARETHEWDGERGKGLRVRRVEYFDPRSGEVLATAPGEPDGPHGGERFAAQVRMDRPGEYELAARVVVRPLDAGDDEEVALVSQTLKVRVDAVETPAMREVTEQFGDDVLRATTVDVRTSSQHGNRQGSQAVDGLMAYGWAAAQDDAVPWIEIEPRRPQRCDHVVLTPIHRAVTERRAWARPTKVRLEVNGKDRGVFDLDPDLFGKTALPLGRRTTVREVRIEVVERAKGERGGEDQVVGFAEIELQYRDR